MSNWFADHKDGLLLATTVALASSFLAEHYDPPAMLFAQLTGIALYFRADHPGAQAGIAFSSWTLLRIGVALLGLRLTFADVAQLRFLPILGVVGLLMLTQGTAVLVARLFGKSLAFGLLTGRSVAICGASAALAMVAVASGSKGIIRIGVETLVLLGMAIGLTHWVLL